MGVASNRTDVKAAAAVAERTLEQLAEPLAALFTPAGDWPQRLLDLAWLEVIRNSAHDSICACSHDDVVAAVLHRFAEARHIGEGVVERTLDRFGESLAVVGAVVVNPSARTRGGVVELDLPGSGAAEGLQLLTETPAEEVLHEIVAADAVMVVEREIFLHPALVELDLRREGDRADVVLREGERLMDAPPENTASVLADLAEHARAQPTGLVRVERHGPPRRRVLARVDSVPGYGWQHWDPTRSGGSTAVTVDGLTLANGLITVVVDDEDGTFSVEGHGGLGHIVDDGDAGDTYNWSPPDDDVFVGGPASVSTSVVETGPVRAVAAVEAVYRLPHHVEGQARVGEVDVAVRTEVELRSGEGFVRVTTTVDNQARDHRLRIGFPLPSPTDHSEAECAFTVVRRGLDAEGGPTERAMSTFPSRRFVRAGGLTIGHEGLLEYELCDIVDGRSHLLGLTLLRSTGMLSQGPMTTRPLPAGPENPLEGSQQQGHQRFRYVVQVGEGDPYALVEDAFVPLQMATGAGLGPVPGDGRHLSITGAEVSSVHREGGSLVVRIFNPTPEGSTVTVGGRHGWQVDLRGRPVAPFDEHLTVAPHQITTLHLAE